MKNKGWEKWARLFSAGAVLLGLVLVVYELRQNSEMIELQILKQTSDAYVSDSLSLLPDNLYEIRQKSIDNPEALTHLEYRVLDSYYWSQVITRWRGLYDLAERGLVDPDDWRKRIQDEAAIYLGYPFGRAYWERSKQTDNTLPDEFEAAIDEAIGPGTTENFPVTAYNEVMRMLADELAQ